MDESGSQGREERDSSKEGHENPQGDLLSHRLTKAWLDGLLHIRGIEKEGVVGSRGYRINCG